MAKRVLPVIGDMPVDRIGREDVLRILTPLDSGRERGQHLPRRHAAPGLPSVRQVAHMDHGRGRHAPRDQMRRAGHRHVVDPACGVRAAVDAPRRAAQELNPARAVSMHQTDSPIVPRSYAIFDSTVPLMAGCAGSVDATAMQRAHMPATDWTAPVADATGSLAVPDC